MRWHAGEGTAAFHDPIRVPKAPEKGLGVNPYFVRFYREVAGDGVGIRAKEHTAQVGSEEREEREEAFREARLPILYCSPTMELGVDISELNVVGLRNVPPTPANYAQRSGRAGRSGQPALVFSYCSAGSPHDAYFFRRPDRMVAGQVRPPRLELANEDLVRSHVHAIWLRAVDKSLGRSLSELLDVSGEEPTLALAARGQGRDQLRRRARSSRASRRPSFLASVDLSEADWYTDHWLDETLDARPPLRFDRACDRWRDLYRAALEMRATQNKVIGDASRSPDDRDRARRLRGEAESQLEILRGEGSESTMQSDFYSYRYFASEGLPARLLVPAPAAVGLDPGARRPGEARRLPVPPAVPRDQRVRPALDRLPRGQPLPHQPGHAPGRPDRRQPARAPRGQALPGVRLPAPGRGDRRRDRRVPALPASRSRPRQGSLFRLSNVATKRRDRINSDEEERQRAWASRSAAPVAFAGPSASPNVHRAEATDAGGDILGLEYGPAATIWRINVGWRRRKPTAPLGFVLDTERGFWQKNDLDPDDKDDPMSGRTERVVPYVEDRRNVLLVTPATELSTEEMASLAAALKNAIQVEFQLEDAELAAEALPTRRQAAGHPLLRGGRGRRRRPAPPRPRARRPAGGRPPGARALPLRSRRRARTAAARPSAKERCEAACYDCLLSYGNQRDHRLLDRQEDRAISSCASRRPTVSVSDTPDTPEEHLAKLKALAGSNLERQLARLPRTPAATRCRRAPRRRLPGSTPGPDFQYDATTVVFIDGPVHDYPNIAERDTRSATRSRTPATS